MWLSLKGLEMTLETRQEATKLGATKQEATKLETKLETTKRDAMKQGATKLETMRELLEGLGSTELGGSQ